MIHTRKEKETLVAVREEGRRYHGKGKRWRGIAKDLPVPSTLGRYFKFNEIFRLEPHVETLSETEKSTLGEKGILQKRESFVGRTY